MGYKSWITSLRGILQEEPAPVSLRNGRWEVRNRKGLWSAARTKIFDEHLDGINRISKSVLSEVDPQFDLPVSERYAASIHGKVPKHSRFLRSGLSETLALLGTRGDELKFCSKGKPEYVASVVVGDLLRKADWTLWASLNDVLPTLAEAAPKRFLDAVENALHEEPCPFDSLFEQEGKIGGGPNYMTGLLWGLECLAWSDQYLARVALLLAELGSHDPGGTVANRPGNSLASIFLPWMPQTIASVDKRVAAVKAVRNYFPEIAWGVLLTLLPHQRQTSLGSYKPRWMNVLPEEWDPKVSVKEYWDQVNCYSEIAVQMAIDEPFRLVDLVSNVENLPPSSLNAVLEILGSEATASLSENDRLPYWACLTEIANKHRRFSDAQWALSDEVVSRIEAAAQILSPNSPALLHQRLFNKSDFDLYENKEDWEEQRKRLGRKRLSAVDQILQYSGLEGVIEFQRSVKFADLVGRALGDLGNRQTEITLLPEFLDSDNENDQRFVNGFIASRFHKNGWPWADGLDKGTWPLQQVCIFLCFLPFEEGTWRRAKKWRAELDAAYWARVAVNPFQTDDDLLPAVEKLIEASRPLSALDCLSKRQNDGLPLDLNLTVQALLDGVKGEKGHGGVDVYNTSILISALQEDPNADPEDLIQVEFAYLPLLDRHGEAKPKTLERQLATQPDFFCDVIRTVYRSSNEGVDIDDPDEERQAHAKNGWQLLHEWKSPPGVLEDGSFSVIQFNSWVEDVISKCESSGHLNVAMVTLGEVLFYSPPDPHGLWIHMAIAATLDSVDADKMRTGFHTEIFNSQGVHWVDPTGAPERPLAQEWLEKAEAVESEGFVRFATELREVSKSYEREAEREIRESLDESCADSSE